MTARDLTMLNDAARELVASGAYGHLVTLRTDGSAQVTLAWFDVDADGTELSFGTLFEQAKLTNVRNDPRVVVSFQGQERNEHGLLPYLVVTGTARVEDGGAPELLQRLAATFLGPGITFPPMPNPPPGYTTRISVDSVSGVGPW